MFDFLKKIKDKVLEKKEVHPIPKELEPQEALEQTIEPEIIEDIQPVLEQETELSQDSEEPNNQEVLIEAEEEIETDSIFIKPDNKPWIDSSPLNDPPEIKTDIFIEPDINPWVENKKEEPPPPVKTDIFIEPDNKPWRDKKPKEEPKEIKTDIFVEPDDKPWIETKPQQILKPIKTDIFIYPEETSSEFIDKKEEPMPLETEAFSIPVESDIKNKEQPLQEEAIISDSAYTESQIVQEQPCAEKTEQTPPFSSKEEPQEITKEHKGWFGLNLNSLKEKISKTTETLITNVVSFASSKEKLDDETIDEIEEKLIKADLGLDVSIQIANKLRENKNKIQPNQLKEYLKVEFSQILLSNQTSNSINFNPGKLNIYLVTGVNGVGKTTLIGKLAYRFKEDGKKVLIAAGDTFRAAAEEQLNIWSNRAGADIVRKDGADPSSVIFDAISKAKKENYDVLLIDTAGRLHNKFNLMEELKKIRKTIERNGDDLLAESLLVLDATTGQNGLQQAKVFSEAVQLTGVALTKLDGSAKGGIIIAIASEMHIPVKLVGVGEKIYDLKDFDPNMFIDALFS